MIQCLKTRYNLDQGSTDHRGSTHRQGATLSIIFDPSPDGSVFFTFSVLVRVGLGYLKFWVALKRADLVCRTPPEAEDLTEGSGLFNVAVVVAPLPIQLLEA